MFLKQFSIPLEKFSSITDTKSEFQFIKDNSNTLDLKTKDIVQTFLNLTCRGYDDIYPHFMIFEYSYYSNYKLFKFLLVEIDSDFVFVPLKYTNIFKTRYYSICYKCVSLNNNLEHVRTVIETIQEKLKVIKYCYKKTNEETLLNNNFYNTKEDFCNYYNTNKYFTQHNFRKISEMVSVVENFKDESAVRNLFNYWAETKNDAESRNDLDVKLCHYSNGSDLISLGFFIKNVLVDYELFCFKNDICFSLCGKNIARRSVSEISELLKIDVKLAKILKRNLTRYEHFIIMKFAFQRAKIVYFLGSGNDKTLLITKKEQTKHYLFYDKVPLSQLQIEENISEYKENPEQLAELW